MEGGIFLEKTSNCNKRGCRVEMSLEVGKKIKINKRVSTFIIEMTVYKIRSCSFIID